MGYSMRDDHNGQDPQSSHSYMDQLQYQNEASRQFSQSYGQNPYGQNSYGQNNYDPNNYGQNVNQNPYGYGQQVFQTRQNVRSNDPFGAGGSGSYTAPSVSQSAINQILANSFLYMFFALLLTGVASMVFYETGALLNMIRSTGTAVIWISFILEIGIVFGSMAAIKANNVGLVAGLYILYCVVNAFTLSVIFYAYTATSIYTTFFMCAFIFGIMAIFGMITKSDLTSIGRLCMFGLFGIIIASVVNIFVGGETLDMVISWIAIVIFLGLTAYDTQKIKRMAASNSSLSPAIISMYGAFELYLDFINLFLRLLRLFGKRN